MVDQWSEGRRSVIRGKRQRGRHGDKESNGKRAGQEAPRGGKEGLVWYHDEYSYSCSLLYE